MAEKKKNKVFSNFEIFQELKKEVSLLDCVSFAENHLTIDGKPFNLSNSGWRYMAELYRMISAQIENKNAKPIVLVKGRQVGATIMAAVLSLHMAASGLYGTAAGKPVIRVMHAFPDLKRCSVYAKDILAAMISGAVEDYIAKRNLKNVRSSAEDTQTEKNFIGNNKIRVDSMGVTGDRIRGSTQDVLFLDEIQDMSKTAIENTVRVLQASPYGATTQGVQVYFGTPKHAGSYFWQIWQNSDKRFYQLKCLVCEQYFQLYNLENENWNEIWVEKDIVQCPHCGKKQKKGEAMDAGHWVATRPFDENGNVPKYIGYHFNMMLSPLYTKEQVLEYWPEHNKNASERSWKNETKGEFYSASATPLTLEEVYTNCLDESRGIAKSITDPSGRMFFLGMDWGEKVETSKDLETKRGKSYTCAVILSIDTSGVLTVENAVRLRKNDPNYKMQVLKKLMVDFHISQGAADFYYANDFMRLAQVNEGFGEKFLSCTNLGNSNKMFSYNPDDFMVSLNKDMLLEELFSLFKRGKIKFPSKGDSQEILMWLIEHCTSMETHVKTKNGVALRTYQKGTVQNDGLMALMYAYTAYRFHVTKKFSTSGNDAVKKDKEKPLVPVLGHIPRMK